MKRSVLLFLGVVFALVRVQGEEADWRVAPREIAALKAWMVDPAQRPVDTNEVALAHPPKDMALFLLVGQSNMAGRAKPTGEPLPETAYALNRDGKWVRAKTPLHFDRVTSGVGPADSFIRAWAKDHPGRPIGVIPCAVGGSPSSTWSPEPATGRVGANYRRAVVRAKIALANGRLEGILWHQGESDHRFCTNAPAYYPIRLAKIAEALRGELGCPKVPFLVGEIGTLPAGQGRVMNPLLAAAVARIPNARLVQAADLTGCLPDKVHFDLSSYTILGTRYYAAWRTCVETEPGR